MEVLKDNFQELLPVIEEAIHGSDFIAIDTELTGLYERVERIKSFDDPQSRYSKFLIVQFGLCTFTYSETKNVFIARPFNFYIFPPSADRKDISDICFLSSGSSLQFLSKCGFDFNKLIGKGIPWINRTDEAKLTIRRENLAQRQIENPPDEETKGNVEKSMKQIEAWFKNPQLEELVVDTPSIRQKRLIFQEIREKYNGFVEGDSRPKAICLKRLTEKERQKKIDADFEETAALLINFRVVIEKMVESKRPIIGHNCFLDFCQFIHQFWEEIPERVSEWKKLVHGMFDTVIDTKHLASTHLKLQKLLPKNGVQDIVEATQKPPFSEYAPKVELDPKFNRYTFNDETLSHEAGYDAYVTGCNFLSLAAFMLHEKEIKIDVYASFFEDSPQPEIEEESEKLSTDKVEIDFRKLYLTSEKLTKFYNKLHLLRSDFRYLNLVGDDGLPPAKPNSFLLSNIPPMTNQQALFAIFEEYGNIFFSWIDDSNCWLTLKEEKKRAKLVEGVLNESKFFSKFIEGGSKYQKGKSKGVTESMGKIVVKSWDKWIQDVTKEQNNVKTDNENRTSKSIGIQTEKIQDYITKTPTMEFSSFWTLPKAEDEWPPNSPEFQSWSNDGTEDNWTKKDDATFNEDAAMNGKRRLPRVDDYDERIKSQYLARNNKLYKTLIPK
ncbi:12272_t:CDS:10 [Ambispora gerdemannii]|uniref:12272_t:CDS:1 n=1 Tax=Ambispora gerdemannii TaxID=144530 RepID=A0A9N8ZLD9_9GLOM|nr:12272_t:CDS:10 [Ambispora gerdemannii]